MQVISITACLLSRAHHIVCPNPAPPPGAPRGAPVTPLPTPRATPQDITLELRPALSCPPQMRIAAQAAPSAVAHAAATLIAAAALAAPHAALAAAKPEELELGAQTFSSVCAACHLGGANVVRPEKTLDLTTLTNNKVADADAILAQVTNGKNNMPAFGGRHAARQLQHARDVTHAARAQAERRADLRGLAVRRLPGEGGVEQGAAVRQVSGQARCTRQQQQHARATRRTRPTCRYVPATLLRVYGME